MVIGRVPFSVSCGTEDLGSSTGRCPVDHPVSCHGEAFSIAHNVASQMGKQEGVGKTRSHNLFATQSQLLGPVPAQSKV